MSSQAENKREKQKWWQVRLSVILWCVAIVLFCAIIRAVMTDRNAWPLVISAVVLMFFIPKDDQ